MLVTFILGGCNSNGQQNKTDTKPTQNVSSNYDIKDEKSGLQKYIELVTSENTQKQQYESSKPEGYVRFSWVPGQSPELNFADGKDYQLYALVDPNFETEDFNTTQVFYLEIVKDNNHAYYGPFKTKHLDFTQ